MRSVLNQHVLVLNRGFTPVQLTSARRALCLVFNEQALALDEDYNTYNFENWRELSAYISESRRVRTPTCDIAIPYVIVLTKYNKVPKRTVRLSRRNIYARDNGTCQYCGRKPSHEEVSIDHIVPRSRGGLSTWTNLVLACTSCNLKKDDKMLSETGMKLLKQPEKPTWPFMGNVKTDSIGLTFWQRFVNNAYWDVTLES